MRRALLLVALLLAGCTAPSAPTDTAAPLPPPPAADPLATPMRFENLTSTLIAVPIVGGEAALAFDVPGGSAWLGGSLKWRTRGTNLTLEAKDPDGATQGQSRTLAGSGPRAPARLDWWAAAPKAGAWTFTVRGTAALQEPLTLQLHTLSGAPQGMHVAEVTRVPEASFVEVNMNMLKGATLEFAWSSAEQVLFNIHTHRDGQTIDFLNTDATSGRSNFTADADGLFSLLWEASAGAVPSPGRAVEVAYRIDGPYELHSAVG